MAYAKELQRQLENGSSRLMVFRDETGLEEGGSLRAELRREVHRCRLMVVIVTLGAVKSTWVAEEIAARLEMRGKRWLGMFRSDARLLPVFLPPASAENLPESFHGLADHLWVAEPFDAAANGEVSSLVLERLRGNLSGWRRLVLLRVMGGAMVSLLISLCWGMWSIERSWQHAMDRKAHEELAQLAARDLRVYDTELELARAHAADPSAARELETWYRSTREKRVVTPNVHLTVPTAWHLLDVSAEGNEPWLLFHDRQDNRVLLVSTHGVMASVDAEGDGQPVATSWPGSSAVFAAGRLQRLPHGDATQSTRSIAETTLGFGYYRPGLSATQLRMLDGRLLLFGEQAEEPHATKVLVFRPDTLALEREIVLKLPSGSNPMVAFHPSENKLGMVAWKPDGQRDRIHLSWLDGNGQLSGETKTFGIPAVGLGSFYPMLDALFVSPDGDQAFVRLLPLSFEFPRGRTEPPIWLALDLKFPRTPLLFGSTATKLIPLGAHQRNEAVFLQEDRELKLLTCIDLIVLDRPVRTVGRGVREFAVRPLDSNTNGFEMALVSGTDLTWYRDDTPVLIVPLGGTEKSLDSVQVRYSSNGQFMGVSYLVGDQATHRQIRVFQSGRPMGANSVPSVQSLQRELNPGVIQVAPK